LGEKFLHQSYIVAAGQISAAQEPSRKARFQGATNALPYQATGLKASRNKKGGIRLPRRCNWRLS